MTRTVLEVDGIDLASTLAPLGVLPGDPTIRLGPGLFQRATQTPDGFASITVTWPAQPTGSTSPVEVTTFGDGAAWLSARAARLIGLEDDITGFDPAEPPLRPLWRRHRGTRITATGTLWHDLACTIVQQRIHRRDAALQWRRFVVGLGTPAADGSDLITPPDPATVGRLSYHHLHRCGIERQRADYLINAAREVSRLHHLVDAPLDEALPHLRALKGVGPWTSACLSAFSWGFQDTLVVGDAGIPSMISWLLAKEPRGSDARMLDLLEPYRPHRYRVVQLAFAARSFPPKRRPPGARTDIRRI